MQQEPQDKETQADSLITVVETLAVVVAVVLVLREQIAQLRKMMVSEVQVHRQASAGPLSLMPVVVVVARVAVHLVSLLVVPVVVVLVVQTSGQVPMEAQT